jgi:AraC-like DNA-binding protein
MPIAAHIKEHRMKKAATLLKETGDSISVIAKSVGYENQSKFSAAFKELYGQTPNEYRR